MAKARFCWEDPLLLDAQLSEDERMIRDAARDYGYFDPRAFWDKVAGVKPDRDRTPTPPPSNGTAPGNEWPRI